MTGKLRQAVRKLAARGGFSLAELLIAVLILGLSTALVLQVLNVAGNLFHRETRISQAQMLCDEIALAVQEELGLGSDFEAYPGAGNEGDDNYVGAIFTSHANRKKGYTCYLSCATGEAKLYYRVDDGTYSPDPYSLVSSASYIHDDLKAYLNYKPDDKYATFTVTVKVKNSNEEELAYNTFTVTPVGEAKPTT